MPSGKIATNCHVLANEARFRVGSGKQFVPILQAEGGVKALCLLDATGLAARAATLGMGRQAQARRHSLFSESPRGLELSLSDRNCVSAARRRSASGPAL